MAAKGGPKAPPASRVLAEVRHGLERGWPAGLTVLSGDDLFHLDAAQRELLAALVPEEDSDFALTLFGSERVEVGTVIAAARSVGMFAARRVVFVRELAALEGEPDALIEYAQAPPGGSYLLVRAPLLDRRRKLHKALATRGRLVLFQSSTRPGAAVADVVALARERGVKLERRAAELVAQLHGADLYRIAGELEKIRAFIGDGKTTVGVETVREVASGTGLLSGWEVADAVVVRDRARALAAARRVVDAGDEPLKIIGGLAWRVRLMLQVKALTAARKRADGPMNRAWSFRAQMEKGLGRYTLQELLAFPSVLLRADRTLKSRAIDPRAVLEDLVDRLTRGQASPREPR
jgi:DNA polymerase-3 subunit delta